MTAVESGIPIGNTHHIPEGVPVHERIYQEMRHKILIGELLPGRPITLRGLAETLGVSPMPVREAVRRLIAERALEMHDNRRVSVPAMTRGKFDEIIVARTLLEPELAARAIPNLSDADIRRLTRIDEEIDGDLRSGDVDAYVRNNFRFHFGIYRAADAKVLLPIVESLWLQFGPFMRIVYGRFGTSQVVDQHKIAVEALANRDEAALRQAIAADVAQGMEIIGKIALTD